MLGPSGTADTEIERPLLRYLGTAFSSRSLENKGLNTTNPAPNLSGPVKSFQERYHFNKETNTERPSSRDMRPFGSISAHQHDIQRRQLQQAGKQTKVTPVVPSPMSNNPACFQINPVPSRDPCQQIRDLGGLYVDATTFTDNLVKPSCLESLSAP